MAEKEEFEDEDQVCDEEDDPEAANMAIVDSHESEDEDQIIDIPAQTPYPAVE